MNHYSQTILSLYSELLAGGCEDSELLAVRRAYDLQCELFRGRHTGSGKTHISHGVGTASVLLSVGAPLRLLPAALVHNAMRVLW
jgi:(p)ppGpp synthase/HD superfamily hydrolase